MAVTTTMVIPIIAAAISIPSALGEIRPATGANRENDSDIQIVKLK